MKPLILEFKEGRKEQVRVYDGHNKEITAHVVPKHLFKDAYKFYDRKGNDISRFITLKFIKNGKEKRKTRKGNKD